MSSLKNPLCLFFVLACHLLSLAGAEEIWIGARSQGMGGCSVSVSDGADGVFLNPAILAELRGTEILGGYGYRCSSEEPSHFHGAAVRAFRFGGLGLGYQRSQDVCWEDALIISHGRFLPYYIASLGFNGKFLSLRASQDQTTECPKRRGALGLDLGFLFRFLGLSIGYTHHNLVVKELGAIGENGTKPGARKAFGLSYRRPEWFYWSLQTSSLSRIVEDLKVGAEIWFGQTVCGRAGIDRGMLTAGIGLDKNTWALDVSALIDKELGNTYSASLRWRMGRRFLFE